MPSSLLCGGWHCCLTYLSSILPTCLLSSYRRTVQSSLHTLRTTLIVILPFWNYLSPLLTEHLAKSSGELRSCRLNCCCCCYSAPLHSEKGFLFFDTVLFIASWWWSWCWCLWWWRWSLWRLFSFVWFADCLCHHHYHHNHQHHRWRDCATWPIITSIICCTLTHWLVSFLFLPFPSSFPQLWPPPQPWVIRLRPVVKVHQCISSRLHTTSPSSFHSHLVLSRITVKSNQSQCKFNALTNTVQSMCVLFPSFLFLPRHIWYSNKSSSLIRQILWWPWSWSQHKFWRCHWYIHIPSLGSVTVVQG